MTLRALLAIEEGSTVIGFDDGRVGTVEAVDLDFGIADCGLPGSALVEVAGSVEYGEGAAVAVGVVVPTFEAGDADCGTAEAFAVGVAATVTGVRVRGGS
jgi:hypothetical protein